MYKKYTFRAARNDTPDADTKDLIDVIRLENKADMDPILSKDGREMKMFLNTLNMNIDHAFDFF